jgi:hypothetical protein
MYNWSSKSCAISFFIAHGYALAGRAAALELELAELRVAQAHNKVAFERSLDEYGYGPKSTCPCVHPGPGRCEGNIPRYDRPN